LPLNYATQTIARVLNTSGEAGESRDACVGGRGACLSSNRAWYLWSPAAADMLWSCDNRRFICNYL